MYDPDDITLSPSMAKKRYNVPQTMTIKSRNSYITTGLDEEIPQNETTNLIRGPQRVKSMM